MNRKYSYETIKQEALKYNSIDDFRNHSNKIYQAAKRYKIIREVTTHIVLKNKKRLDIEVINSAKKFNTLKEFREKDKGGYKICLDRSLSKKAFSHMKCSGSIKDRLVYAFIFENNDCYIGITSDLNKRILEHKRSTKTIINNIKNNIKYNVVELTKKINYKKSQQKEEFYINKFKGSNFNILNKNKPGSLGPNNTKYTDDYLLNEASKYASASSLQKQNLKIYAALWKRNLNKKVLYSGDL